MTPTPIRCSLSMLALLASAACFAPTFEARLAGPDAGFRSGDAGSCTSSCAGRQCGSDGCGSTCGSCQVGQQCGSDGHCVGGNNKCEGVTCHVGESCDAADGICKCTGSPNQGSCPANLVCSSTLRCVEVLDPCATTACPADSPVCVDVGDVAVCQCTPISCGVGLGCVGGQCQRSQCTPPCSGEVPDCDLATLTCRCNANSCAAGRKCVNNVCVDVGCQPPCVGEMPDCVATLCRCNAASCSAGRTCGVDGQCHTASVCTVESAYGSLSVAGTVQSQPGFLSLAGPLPSSDGTSDELEIELYDGYGVFLTGTILTGTFTLSGDDLNYGTCGLCVRLFGNTDSTGLPAAYYMATGGTVTLSSITGTLVGTLTNATFEHVDIANDYTSTPNADGCASAIAEVDFAGAIAVTCDPLAPTACDALTQGCYYDGSGGYTCSDKGSVPTGGTCSDTLICIPGDECLGNATSGYKCEKYCDIVAGTGCSGSDFCLSIGGPAVGACGPCPTAPCAAACCAGGMVCDATATPNVCKAAPACDPLATPNPCPTNQACYYNWDTYQFQCDTAGRIADGSVCNAETDCIAGDGCGSNYTCVPYCDPMVSACGAGGTLSCTDYNGDGTLGYCE